MGSCLLQHYTAFHGAEEAHSSSMEGLTKLLSCGVRHEKLRNEMLQSLLLLRVPILDIGVQDTYN